MRDAHNSPAAGHPAGDATAASGAEPGNTKVAILFTDMQGSSAFYKEHGNIAGRIMIQRLYDMLFPIVRGYKGRVVKTIGDSIMASFSSAADALWAAVAMQKRLAAHNREHTRPQEQLLIRVTVNYGFALVEEQDVFGDVVNVAGKLISSCEARQIIITEAFYHEVAACTEVGFTRLSDSGGPAAYRVEWDVAAGGDPGRMYVLSLGMERPPGDQAKQSAGLGRLGRVLERRADAVISAGAGEINAQFHDPGDCLAAACQVLRYCMDGASEHPGPAHMVRIGLHAADADSDRGSGLPEAVQAALAARDSAEPCEIVVTAAMHAGLPKNLQQRCIPVKGSPGGNTLYLVQAGSGQEAAPALSPLLPGGDPAAPLPACCYCGSAGHRAAACPSKHIDKADGYLEKLAYVPLEEIRADFQSRYRDIVRPLEGGQEDDRFEILFRGDPQDSFALMFFAFYELSAGFQLRALSRLYHASSAGRERPARKTGSIMMGADCLRVGRNEQAAGWFARAAAEQPGDYRPHVALGMLALEQGRPEQAAGHFRQALAFSLTAAQQGPVRLLLARAHETAGALGDARREMQRALADMADWHDGRYYLGALLAREGKLGMAFEIFTKLIRLNPRYYLMVALNPQLNAVQNEIFAFLNRELAAMRARARQSLAALQSLLDQRRAWFQEDDEDFKGARELYSKAAEIMNSESVAGLMDVPALEDTAAGMLKNALRHRQATVCKQAAAFGRHLAEHRGYLERYPYRSMLSERDEKDARAFAALLDASLREAERIPAPSPRDAAAMLERLARESAQLSARRTRLEWTRHLLFAGECGTKMTGVFAAVAGLTALCACGILLLYAGYESSFAELSPAQVEGFVRFGVFAGAVAGGTGSIVWVVRQYRNRQAKL